MLVAVSSPVTRPLGTGPFGAVQVFEPYPGCDNVVFARTAARHAPSPPPSTASQRSSSVLPPGRARRTLPAGPGSCSSGPATSWPDGRRSASAGSSAPTNSSGETVHRLSTRTPGPRWRPTPSRGPRGGPSPGTRCCCRPALCTCAIAHRQLGHDPSPDRRARRRGLAAWAAVTDLGPHRGEAVDRQAFGVPAVGPAGHPVELRSGVGDEEQRRTGLLHRPGGAVDRTRSTRGRRGSRRGHRRRPSETERRPSLRTSRVERALASTSGDCDRATSKLTPSLTRVVDAATVDRTTIGSRAELSRTHTVE